jgi:hypothetical protein
MSINHIRLLHLYISLFHLQEKSRIFKIFGILEQRNNDIVLIAHNVLKIQDLHGSMNTLSLLSTIVRPMYYQ